MELGKGDEPCTSRPRHLASGREKRRRARDNRAEIVKARSIGQITRRDLVRWGIFTSQWPAGLQERPEPVCPQRLCGHPDRHAAQPAVRGAEVHPAHAAAAAADARAHDAIGAGHRGRCRVRRPVCGAAQRQAHVLSQRFQQLYAAIREPNPFRNPDDQQGPDGRPPAGRVLRASALGRVLPQGRLRDVVDAMRAGHQVPPELPRPGPQRGLDLRHRQCRAGEHASAR